MEELQRARDYPPRELSIPSEKEQAIKGFIQQLDEQDVSAKVTIICIAANYHLALSHSNPFTPPPQVSKYWPRRSPPQVYKNKQKPLAVEYKNAHNEDDFMEYFEKYKDIWFEKGIIDEGSSMEYR